MHMPFYVLNTHHRRMKGIWLSALHEAEASATSRLFDAATEAIPI
jgi:hypothetical protein